MPTDLLDDLRRAYPSERVEAPDATPVWQRGRRARRRRHATRAVAAAAVVAVASVGVLEVARSTGVAVHDEPVAPAAQHPAGWDLLPPGTFDDDRIEARLAGWETVLELGPVRDAAFDVAADGTLAAFVPTTGTIVVRTRDGGQRTIDASFLLEPFPAERSLHHLRIGPDRRYYLTSQDPEAARDPQRLTVFEPDGDLVGSKTTAVSHQPPVFDDGQVVLRTDDGWGSVAAIGAPLHERGRPTTPDLPTVTWIDDQGSIVNQVTGGAFVGERYTLEQDGRTLSWTGPTDGVVGWASGATREDRTPAVLVQYEDAPPLVLVPTLDGLLAAWADPAATGLRGVGDNRVVTAETPDGMLLYWVQEVGDGSAIVRSAPGDPRHEAVRPARDPADEARTRFRSCVEDRGFTAPSIDVRVVGDALRVDGFQLESIPPNADRPAEEHTAAGARCWDQVGRALGMRIG